MEQSKSTEYKVGIFVTLGIFLFLVFIVVLGGDKAIFRRTITLHLHVDETMGLVVGSAIQVAGIPAGNVTQISFSDADEKLDIHLRIDKALSKLITAGSTAGLRTQGALGDKFINVVPGPREAEPLKDGDIIETEAGSDLLTTLGRSGSKIEKAFVILEQVEKMVLGLNERHFAQNLSDTMQSLKNSSQSLEQILGGVKGRDGKNTAIKKSLDKLASILEKIDAGQGTLGGLINDPTVHEDLKSLLGGAKRSKLLKYLIRQTIQKSEEEENKASSEK